MDLPESSSPGPTAPQLSAPTGDPLLEPSLDYGTLGPGSDSAGSSAASGPAQTAKRTNLGPFVAIVVGVFLALVVVDIGRLGSVWSRFTGSFHFPNAAVAPSVKNIGDLDRLPPQEQAVALLERAVTRSKGAADQISSRVDGWQGKLQWSPQIATLTTAALNSNDMRVRESGIEVELAAYGLAKNSASLEYLLKTVDSSDHAQRIWALWALGLIGNRHVENGRVVQVLTAHLKDSDADSRRWAVEGLALVGTTQTIVPLLKTMHDDPDSGVRERAACGLAQSGMFTHEQRLTAVPQLLKYTDDPSLDEQTHAWAFQALGDISGQHLPNDSSAWRSWYESTRTD